MDHQQVPKILSTAKIGVIPLPDMPKFRHNIACKGFEYMACGMPVISTDLPPQRLFIKENKTGLYFRSGEAEELAEKIEYLLDNPQTAQAMGEAGRHEVERKWNCENDQAKLCDFYDRINQMNRRNIFRPSQ